MNFNLAWIASLFFMSTGLVEAVVIAIGPDKDTTIFEENAALSNGAGSFLFAGRTNGMIGTTIRRALLSFDVAGIVPAGATINSAILTLTLGQTRPGSQPVTLHRMTESWGEAASNAPGEEGQGAFALAGDATWTDNILGTSLWSAAGGDFVAASSASTSVGGVGSYQWNNGDMVTDAQSWLDTPAQNFGWILLGNEGAAGSAKRFGSREDGDAPSLQIDYTPIPEPSFVLLLILGIALTSLRHRGTQSE